MTIKRTPLTTVMSVNGSVICDCKADTFRIGVAVAASGTNFMRVLECTACGHQMPVVHQSGMDLQPTVKLPHG